MPSPYESLSIVLLESWAVGKPVLVNENSDVLRGQVRRANGGLAYRNYEEFEAAVDLLRFGGAGHVFGRQGWEFVNRNYRWEVIEKAYLGIAPAARIEA
jgi:glycosyltransferase involved in cell wall biosynthesis